jgi:hypothetical protein
VNSIFKLSNGLQLCKRCILFLNFIRSKHKMHGCVICRHQQSFSELAKWIDFRESRRSTLISPLWTQHSKAQADTPLPCATLRVECFVYIRFISAHTFSRNSKFNTRCVDVLSVRTNNHLVKGQVDRFVGIFKRRLNYIYLFLSTLAYYVIYKTQNKTESIKDDQGHP